MCNLKCNNSTQRRVFKLGKTSKKNWRKKTVFFSFEGKKWKIAFIYLLVHVGLLYNSEIRIVYIRQYKRKKIITTNNNCLEQFAIIFLCFKFDLMTLNEVLKVKRFNVLKLTKSCYVIEDNPS